MRIHRLELTGFGPYRTLQVVDFDAFAADGIFLITGRTGAGKSSVLDGVCFALYGGVPRYESGPKRLRSDHCAPEDPTRVRLEFTVAGRRWRVTRSPEYDRPARRGDGTTTEPARAQLEEEVDGQWTGRATRPREVAQALDEIIGLNLAQFQQVILLAQNKFSRFLLADNTERQTLLRSLFGTRRFEEYRERLEDRARLSRAAVDTARDRLAAVLDLAEAEVRLALEADASDAGDRDAPEVEDSDETDRVDHRDDTDVATADADARRARLERAEHRARHRREIQGARRASADAAYAAAAEAHRRALVLADARSERQRLAEQDAALAADADRMAQERARVDRAAAANPLLQWLHADEAAAGERVDALAACGRAEARWLERGGDPGADPERSAEELAGQAALLEQSVAVEAGVADRAAEVAAASAEVDEAQRALGDAERELESIPQQERELRSLIAAARERAAAAAAAAAGRDDLARRGEAARRAAILAPRVRETVAQYEAAASRSADASAAVAALLRRRLGGYAAELAHALGDDEPCPVCGSRTHPHPAPPVPNPVSDEMFAEAESTRDAAVAEERRAAEEARRVGEDHAAAASLAQGEDPDDVEARLVALDAQRASAIEAEQSARLLQTELDRVLASVPAAAAERAVRAERLAAARERLAVAMADHDAAVAEVARARGDHATVADRVVEIAALRDAARDLVEARRRAAVASAAQEHARADLLAALARSPFASAEEAAEAAMADSDLAAVRDRLAAFAAESAGVQQRLLAVELQLAGTEDADADVPAAAAALGIADAQRSDAIAGEQAARDLAERLSSLRQQVEQAVTRWREAEQDAGAVVRLADTVAGRAPNTMKMDLETFVLAAELEEIVAAANLRLSEMTSGRFSLHHTDALAARGAASGLGIEVLDAHTGRMRPPRSLSGGETFLASLALALGLAEVVTARTGGIRLDTLFIDEGFGSLDAETLDLAMNTLEQLRSGGRTIGVISHVDAMRERLPAHLEVIATAGGPSVLRHRSVTDGSAPAGQVEPAPLAAF